jgi:hypothetical protein
MHANQQHPDREDECDPPPVRDDQQEQQGAAVPDNAIHREMMPVRNPMVHVEIMKAPAIFIAKMLRRASLTARPK